MMNLLKAEFRKMFTVRSTYFIIAVVVLLELLFGFYISGWRAAPADLHNASTLATAVTDAISTIGIFPALIALLLLAHEYRYNTIMYTLTASNSRSKVLLAKILAISGFAIVFTLIFGAMSPLLTLAGMHAHHLKLVPQTLHYWDLLWRSLLFGWGYAMAGLVITALIRNQVGAIIILFVVPGTLESLLSLILKHNTVYLPFSSLHQVIGNGQTVTSNLSTIDAALVFSGYLIVAWAVAWVLFLRRDAN
jgi:ABC-2 type transport system permease protein